jgi:hypothetical protein
LEESKLANLSRREIIEAKTEVQRLVDSFEITIKTAPFVAQKELLRQFIHKIVVNRENDTIEVFLKPIPRFVASANTDSTCIKVVKKLNRKVRKVSADKTPSQQTEASSVETAVLVENK